MASGPPATTSAGTLSATSTNLVPDVWQEVQQHAAKNLSSKDVKRLESIGNFEEFTIGLQSRTQQYADGSKTNTILKKLSRPLNHLKSLSDAISVMIQFQGTPACLIWGSLMIVIDVCLRFVDILERIVDMYAEMMSAMPRFDRYMQLYSTERHLIEAVARLYYDYVTFSITTIKLTKRRPWIVFLKLFWRPIQKDFDNTMKKIETHAREAERWAKAANYAEQQRNADEAARRHIEIVRVFPQVVIQSKDQREILSFSMPRNPKFFGREDVLADIFRHLEPPRTGSDSDESQTVLRSYTLQGFGGLGKTQTATEYVYRYQGHYRTIFWFRAETSTVLRQELADAAKKVGVVPEGQMPDVAACISLFLAWLFETKQNWLVVFDNVDKWADIRDVWPAGQHGSILLTTRDVELASHTTGKWHLTTYDKSDGEGFLGSLLKDCDDDVKDGLEQLNQELDGYPLGLSHAAGYIVTHHVTCRDLLSIWRDMRSTRAVNSSSVSLSSLPGYKFSLEDVWTLSLGKLSDNAREILDMTVFMNPDLIQQDIVERLADQANQGGLSDQEWSKAVNLRRHQIATLLRSLSLHSLLIRGVGGKRYSIHRLLQRDLLLRLQDDPAKFQASFDKATALIRQQFPAQHVAEPLTPFWAECQEMLPHVMRLQAVYADSPNLLTAHGEVLGSLLGDSAYYQWERGLLKEALKLCDAARKILEATANDASVHKADVLNVIGAIYIESGAAHIEEGTKIMERVLLIRRNRLARWRGDEEEAAGPEFHDDYVCVSNALSNLSCCWIGLRQWGKGAEAIDEAIRMFRRYCTEESHPYGFAERYANLSQVLAGQGKLEEGIEYARKATELQKKAFGETDVRACVFESYWGNFLILAGRVDEAYERHQAALDIRVKKLGPGSNDVAKSLYFVAYCRYRLGDYDEAERKLLEAQAIYSRMYWTENRMARAYFLRAMISEKRGDKETTRRLKMEAGELRKALVGVDPSDEDTLGLYEQMVFYH